MQGDEKSCFIDTNILIYATLEKDYRFKKSREILLKENSPVGTRYTSVQNLAEMYPNLTGPKMDIPDSPSTARKKIESIAALPELTVLPLTSDVVSLALELCETHGKQKQDYFDMQIAAFLKRYGIGFLYTENSKDFFAVEGIVAVNPFASEGGREN